jgi:hypothetical protein
MNDENLKHFMEKGWAEIQPHLPAIFQLMMKDACIFKETFDDCLKDGEELF